MSKALPLLFATSIAIAGCGGGGSAHVPSSAIVPAVTETASPKSIGPDSDPRSQIRNECWYALDPGHLSITNDAIGPDGGSKGGTTYGSYVISKPGWSYLSKSVDAGGGALGSVLGYYGGKVSDIIPTGGGLTQAQQSQYVNGLSNDQYGLNGRDPVLNKYPLNNTLTNYGHGTECLEFAMMVIYRARHGKVYQFNYPKSTKGYGAATGAQVGDLIFHLQKTDASGKVLWSNHTAVCVRNDGSNVTVVDSNYAAHEVIANHTFSYGTLNSQEYYCLPATNYIP